MVRIGRSGAALGLAGLLLSQAGCVTPMGSLATSTLPAVPSVREELPKDKALQTCLTYARTLDKGGSDEGAIEQYEKVLRLSPDHAESMRRLAVLYDRKADFSKAELAYRKLAKLYPRDADLMCDWGYSYYLRNNWKEAEAKLRRALELDKAHTRARCNMGLVLGQQDRFDEAFQAFVQAGLDQADAHCDLAFIYWTKGKEYYERARQECYLARRLNPACSKAQELLAQIEDAQRPRSERVAVKSASQGAERSRPVASYGAEEKYPLPAGWARVPTNQSPGEATPGVATSNVSSPAMPRPIMSSATKGVNEGTVTGLD